MIKKLFPMPVHSAMLLGVWVFLNEFSFAHFVLGSFLAITIPWICAPMSDEHPGVKKPIKAFKYLLLVVWDIIVSNFEVAARILRSNKHLRPGFIALPLDIHEPFPLAVLASTISLTPGTVSVDFSDDRQWLYIHALHIDNEDDIINTIKSRYETPLKEIFQC
ncbi:Na+/H+ antiporter subunit E [Bermanella marisrubri]|uniref:Multisubunit Na+/H+ antiporter, MnhE subunit n=1 Tax=Bermanella marisrubri TaxID=207949 RepID=Q1MYX8_9GAMM|nr:Na+/H+ antiporter subunit E [Bermanella marisrubri]EAT11163.1 Multisubunit Na+/H+ antiporter, MnhE subunit [Oceanobacter sp. RED65] [Bermanella marisrubri]QIZ83386.1 Na+/H+ antiporter subunit E [Bermanella marisrubri]